MNICGEPIPGTFGICMLDKGHSGMHSPLHHHYIYAGWPTHSTTTDSTAVIAIEARYPYLSGHTFVRCESSKSGACIFCECFREQHPIERQGSEEPVSERQTRMLLKELDKRSQV